MRKIFHTPKFKVLTSFLTSTLVSVALSACTNSLETHDSKKRSAPKNENDLGVLVSGTSESELATVLDKHPEAKFRSLNKNAGLFEIFNVPISQLKTELRQNEKIQLTPNLWIPRETKPQKDLALLANEIADNKVQLSAEGEQVQMLNRCFRDTAAPRATIFYIEPKEGIPADVAIEMGTEIELVGQAEPHPLNPSPLTAAFAIVTPGDEAAAPTVLFGNRIRIKTNAMGIYRIIFIVQDNRDVCTMVQTYIAVTGNKDFVGNDLNVNDRLMGLKLSDFDYLNRVEGEQAWGATTQGEGVTIAIIDSGVNFNHPALVKNIATNPGEIQGNGIDDDQNGWIDDYVGYDFVNQDGSPYDDEGHGSHVAGLAASSVFGVAKLARILSVKAMGPLGSDTGTIAAAVRYAVDRKAKVINLSLGTYGEVVPEIKRAVKYAEDNNVLIVAASGNGHPFFGKGLSTDQIPIYPSSFPNSNILSVAATTKGVEGLAPYSNFGMQSVDLAAPGGDDPNDLLTSSYFENPKQLEYKGMSGTSMASPIVAGAAAVVFAINPTLTPAQVSKILMDSGTKLDSLKDKIKSGATLNVRAAAELARTASF